MDQRFKKSIEVINFIVNDLNLDNPKQLSDSLGFDRPERIYKILRGKVAISRNLADIIHEKYPQYDKNWLLTGEGPMKKGAASQEPVASDAQDEYKISGADINSIRQDVRAVNENLHALTAGMMKNFESLGNGQMQIMKNQLKLIQFTEQLDPKKIATATGRLDQFLEAQSK